MGGGVKSSIGINLIGNVALAASRWSVFVLIVKIVQREVMEKGVADLTIATAVCGPVFVLLGGGLRQIVAVQYFTQGEWLRIVAGRFSLGVCAIGLCVVSGWVWGVGEGVGVLCAVAAARFADGMSELVYALLQRRDLFKPIAFFKIARGTISTAVIGCSLGSGQSLAVALGLAALCWWAQLLVFEIPRGLNELRDKEVSTLTVLGGRQGGVNGALFIEGLLLSTAMALGAFSAFLPAYVLDWRGGHRLLAIYGTLYCFVAAQQMIYVSFGQCLVPRFASLFHVGEAAAIRRSLGVAMGSVMLVALIAAGFMQVFGPVLLGQIYSEDFSGQAGGLAALLLAGGLTGVCAIAGSALTSARVYGRQIVVSLIHIVVQGSVLIGFGDQLTFVQIGFAQGIAAVFAIVVMRVISTPQFEARRVRNPKHGQDDTQVFSSSGNRAA
jgi:O-antigen/teichoic acid export membrane protein